MASKAKKVAAKKPVKKVAAKKPVAKKAVVKKATKPAAKKASKAVSKKSPAKAVKKTAVKKPVKAIAKTSTKKTKAQVNEKPAVKKATAPVLTTAKPVIKNLDYSKAITPLGDRLVLRVVQAAKMTAGGLYIPDMVSDAAGHLKGEVLAVGGGGKNKKGAVRPLDVRKGDFVLFAEHAGTKIEFNSEELQIVHEADVMGIVQK